MSMPARNAGRCGPAAAGGEAGAWGAGGGGTASCDASVCDHWFATTVATARTTKNLAPISSLRSVLPACLGPTNGQARFSRRHRHLVRRNQRFRPAVDDLVLRTQLLRQLLHRPVETMSAEQRNALATRFTRAGVEQEGTLARAVLFVVIE